MQILKPMYNSHIKWVRYKWLKKNVKTNGIKNKNTKVICTEGLKITGEI